MIKWFTIGFLVLVAIAAILVMTLCLADPEGRGSKPAAIAFLAATIAAVAAIVAAICW